MRLISRELDSTDLANDAGIYEIPFQLNSNQLKYYIGMTKCKFSKRLKNIKEMLNVINSTQPYQDFAPIIK